MARKQTVVDPICRLGLVTRPQWYSSSRGPLLSSTQNKPPLPPSPAKAKQEFLKAAKNDPLLQMAQLQKELDIVRERAAERLEQKLQKSVWRRLTDPLRRHSHSWINVGAVLLAYILAHNLYMRTKEKRLLESELQVAAEQRDAYQVALRDLLQPGTLEELAAKCAQELQASSDENAGGKRLPSFFKSSPTSSSDIKTAIQSTLQQQLQAKIGDLTLTDEERRIKEMQQAWEESQRSIVVVEEESPEQQLLQSVLQGGDGTGGDKATKEKATTKQQRRVISM